jgi:hypothetical protein
MFIKSFLFGATVAALALLVPAATMAQAPRPDFPGAKQQDQDPGLSPRSDFPGPKQSDADTTKTPQSDSPGSQQGENPSK